MVLEGAELALPASPALSASCPHLLSFSWLVSALQPMPSLTSGPLHVYFSPPGSSPSNSVPSEWLLLLWISAQTSVLQTKSSDKIRSPLWLLSQHQVFSPLALITVVILEALVGDSPGLSPLLDHKLMRAGPESLFFSLLYAPCLAQCLAPSRPRGEILGLNEWGRCWFRRDIPLVCLSTWQIIRGPSKSQTVSDDDPPASNLQKTQCPLKGLGH